MLLLLVVVCFRHKLSGGRCHCLSVFSRAPTVQWAAMHGFRSMLRQPGLPAIAPWSHWLHTDAASCCAGWCICFHIAVRSYAITTFIGDPGAVWICHFYRSTSMEAAAASGVLGQTQRTRIRRQSPIITRTGSKAHQCTKQNTIWVQTDVVVNSQHNVMS